MVNVFLKHCPNYDFDLLKEVIRDALNSTSFVNIKKDDTVFLKVNCLGPYREELAITTNPIFLKAVIELVKEKTLNILVGDNPASRDIIFCLKKNGMYDVICEENVKVFNPLEQVEIINNDAKNFRSFMVSKQIVECDYLINIPKLKTHALTYFTCAQKNLFGLIYGLNKSSWHVKAPTPLDFANAIADLYGAIIDHFGKDHIINICDAIDCLEGEGPGPSGSKCFVGAVLAANDALALDKVAIEVAGLDYNSYALGKGLVNTNYGETNLDNITIIGDEIESFNNIHIKEPDKKVTSSITKLVNHKFIRNLCLEHPLVDKNKCVKCGECAKMCSSHAMTILKGEYPKLKSKKCIRCWCCSEVCPQSAIKKSNRPLIGKILFK